jgi:hypothetical protein
VLLEVVKLKKKLILFALIFAFPAAGLFDQDALLEKTNAFYDQDDYVNAKELYFQVLSSDKFTGGVLYAASW